jgi:hypothetical protein
MKRKVKKSKIQRSRRTRTTSVPPTQETLSNSRNDEAEASTVLCKDCRIASPVESLIAVDALHVQCPLCLYVFFMDEMERKALSDAGYSPAEATGAYPRR